MADALAEACMDEEGKGPTFTVEGFDHNHPYEVKYEGRCSWASWDNHQANWNIHSWDAMKDCLKYGFDISDEGEVTAKDNDWHQKELMEET